MRGLCICFGNASRAASVSVSCMSGQLIWSSGISAKWLATMSLYFPLCPSWGRVHFMRVGSAGSFGGFSLMRIVAARG